MWTFQTQTDEVYGYDLPAFSYKNQCDFVGLFICPSLKIKEPTIRKPFHAQYLRDKAFSEAILSHNVDEVMPFLRESTNETTITPFYHIKKETPQVQYSVVTYIAMYGNYEMLKAAMDLNLNSSPDFYRTLVDCILFFIQSGFTYKKIKLLAKSLKKYN